jgi:hypothetical protein
MTSNDLKLHLYIYEKKETIFLMLKEDVLIEKSYLKVDSDKKRNEIVKQLLSTMVKEAQKNYDFAKIDSPWIEDKNGIFEIDLSKLYRDLKVEARL